MIKGSIHQEDKTIINICAHDNGAQTISLTRGVGKTGQPLVKERN